MVIMCKLKMRFKIIIKNYIKKIINNFIINYKEKAQFIM